MLLQVDGRRHQADLQLGGNCSVLTLCISYVVQYLCKIGLSSGTKAGTFDPAREQADLNQIFWDPEMADATQSFFIRYAYFLPI